MSNTICLPTEHYLLLMLIFIGITLYYIYKMQNIDFNLSLNNDSLSQLSKQLNVLDQVLILVSYISIFKY